MMKKSTFGAVLAFMFAAAGALTAAALYLYHREKELDEYERLLFGDDMDPRRFCRPAAAAGGFWRV